MKIAILGTVHPKGLEFLKENELEIVEVTNFNKQNLQEELKFIDAILLRTSRLDKDILEHCKKLKIISRHGVGYDNVDLNYLNKKKIALCITSTSNAVSVAEHVMSFFLYLTKNLSLSDKLVKGGNFTQRSELPNFFELYKKKITYSWFWQNRKRSCKEMSRF